jgi:DNA repair protein RecO (recombination protein O)
MSQPEYRRLARRAFLHHATGQIVQPAEGFVDVEVRVVLECNQQRTTGKILVRDLVLHELTKLTPRLGRMDQGLQERRLYPMRLVRTDAIVLHTVPARERDKLVVFLTPEHGKVKGFAYGARGIKSRFGASLEPLAKVRIGYAEREAEEAVRIESIELIRSLFPAQQELLRSVAATYIAEMVDTFAPANDPAELIYRLLDRASEAMLDSKSPIAIVAYVEVWMLRLGGIFPSTRACMQCGGEIGRPLRFDTKVEGFVCDNCATRDAFIVSNDVVAELDAIARLPVAEFAQRDIAGDVLFEVRSLAGTIRRNFLGHELKSFEILSSVVAS